MSALKALFAVTASLCFAGQAFATADYGAAASFLVRFDPIPSADQFDCGGTGLNGAGAYAAFGICGTGWTPGSDLVATVGTVVGFAGDDTGTLAGLSYVSVEAQHVLTFEFPEASPVSLTLTLLDSSVYFNHTTDFAWEVAWADAGISMLMDGEDIWFDESGHYSQLLSGTHTLTLRAHASGHAESNPVPEPSTFILLGAGLVGMAGCARRRVKQ